MDAGPSQVYHPPNYEFQNNPFQIPSVFDQHPIHAHHQYQSVLNAPATAAQLNNNNNNTMNNNGMEIEQQQSQRNFKSFSVVFLVLAGLALVWLLYDTFWVPASSASEDSNSNINNNNASTKTLSVTSQGSAGVTPNRVQFYVRVIGVGATNNLATMNVQNHTQHLMTSLNMNGVPQQNIFPGSISMYHAEASGPVLISGPDATGTVFANPSAGANSASISVGSIPPATQFNIPTDGSYFAFQIVTVDTDIPPNGLAEPNGVVCMWIQILTNCSNPGFVMTFGATQSVLTSLESQAFQNAINVGRVKAASIAQNERYTLGTVSGVEQKTPNIATSSVFTSNNIQLYSSAQAKVNVSTIVAVTFLMH
jgi:uncharacterized protein YggE